MDKTFDYMRQKCTAYQRLNLSDFIGSLIKAYDVRIQKDPASSIWRPVGNSKEEQTLSVVVTNTFLNSRPMEPTDQQQTRPKKSDKPSVGFSDALTLVDSAGLADRVAGGVKSPLHRIARAPSGTSIKVSEFQSRKNQSLTNFSSLSRSWAREFANKNKGTAIFEEPPTNQRKIPVNLAPWIKKPTTDYDEEVVEGIKPQSLFTLNPVLDDLLKIREEQSVVSSAPLGSPRSSPRGKFSLTREFSKLSTPTSLNAKKEGVRRHETSHLRIRTHRSASSNTNPFDSTKSTGTDAGPETSLRSRWVATDPKRFAIPSTTSTKTLPVSSGSTIRLLTGPSLPKPSIIVLTALRRIGTAGGKHSTPASPTTRTVLKVVPQSKRIVRAQ